MLRIIVIGLGSMGRRRIRLLKEINSGIVIYGVDKNKERCDKVHNEHGINTYMDLNEALHSIDKKPDAAIISTSPLSHAFIIKECLIAGLHVFTELNLVSDQYEENIRLANTKGKVLFLSSTFLYRDEICYIQKKIGIGNWKTVLNYTYHIGQYLPDWHPWENYKDFFVSKKNTNGCREIFAIELPWLQKVFGQVKSFNVIKGRSSLLDIDYPDTYHLLLCHKNGTIGSLQVDIVSRKAVRNLEIYGESIYLSWDGTPEGLKLYNFETKKNEDIILYDNAEHIDGYKSFIIENAYKNELEAFLKEISGKKASKYSFKEDLETLKLIDYIERDK